MADDQCTARAFQRPAALLAPWFIWLITAWLGASGAVVLATGSYGWGVALLLAAVLGVAEYLWHQMTPILTLSADQLVLRRSFYLPRRRIPVSAIAEVDRSAPGAVLLVLKDGSRERIPLQWLVWGDHPVFLTSLNDAIEQAKARRANPRECRAG